MPWPFDLPAVVGSGGLLQTYTDIVVKRSIGAREAGIAAERPGAALTVSAKCSAGTGFSATASARVRLCRAHPMAFEYAASGRVVRSRSPASHLPAGDLIAATAPPKPARISRFRPTSEGNSENRATAFLRSPYIQNYLRRSLIFPESAARH